MFGVFLFLYLSSFTELHTSSTHTLHPHTLTISLSFFCSKIFSRNIIYMAKQRLQGQLVYIYYFNLFLFEFRFLKCMMSFMKNIFYKNEIFF